MKAFKKIGFLVLLSFLLAACGREETENLSGEMTLDGHWTVRDATVAGQSAIQLAEEYEDELDIDVNDFTSGAEGSREFDLEFYYNEGLLTIVSDDEAIELDYEIVNRDEENREMTLEYVLSDDEAEIFIEEVMMFSDDGERITTETSVENVEFLQGEDGEPSAYEKELNNIGGEAVLTFIYGLDLELELEYVDDARVPDEE